MGGYDAGYYGYLWAEVIGDDLWGRFEAEGITSPAVGMAYRRAILEPNGTRSGGRDGRRVPGSPGIGAELPADARPGLAGVPRASRPTFAGTCAPIR